MKISDLIKTSFRAVTGNKLQSFLSMLGIIIGIGAVVAIVSISEGAKAEIQEQIADMGTNTISANIYDLDSKGFDLDADMLYPMTKSKYIDYLTVEGSSYVQIEYNETNVGYQTYGVDTFYLDYKDISINGGRFINTADIIDNRNVCVIGSDVANDIFGLVNPVGSYLTFKTTNYATGETLNSTFQVIGVLNDKSSSGFSRYNSNIYVPYTTFESVLNGNINSFYIIGNDTNTLNYAEEDARLYIESMIYPYIVDELNGESESSYYPYPDGPIYYDSDGIMYKEDVVSSSAVVVPEGDSEMIIGGNGGYYDDSNPVEDYYYLFNTGDYINSAMQVVNTITLMISGIAAISLLVGGIGIANVMFMTVLERTKEIGLRKAVGATNRDIVFQFLIQAVIITMIGGIIGLFFGYGLSNIIGALVEELNPIMNITVALSVFGVATLVGILAGIFPARRAARLNPIDALRYE